MQARSAQVSSVPLLSGCPVAPPTCEIMCTRIISTIGSLRCPRAAFRARRVCLVGLCCSSSLLHEVLFLPLKALFFLLHLVLNSGTLISRFCHCRSSILQSCCLILLVMVLVMKAQISLGISVNPDWSPASAWVLSRCGHWLTASEPLLWFHQKVLIMINGSSGFLMCKFARS